MKTLVYLFIAASAISSAFASEVIQEPGSYLSPKGTTSLTISNSQVPKAVFSFVHPDGKRTSVHFMLSADGAWACLLKDEMTLWVYRKEDSFIRAISIMPPQEGGQFRTGTRRVSIETERDEIPAELRAVMK